jgi:hypothetical protein
MKKLIAYLLTYLLTPWSRVLLEKLTSKKLIATLSNFANAPKIEIK